MWRERFDELLSSLRFIHQPEMRPSSCSSEDYRWMLVNDFVQNFNAHRAQRFSPPDRICVDESISRWHGASGFWINIGLPKYIAIDGKPENGCEMQNAGCGRSGVMTRLKLVPTPESEDASQAQNSDGLAHGTAVLTELVGLLAMSNRVACAYSYFASVASAEEL
jgi:hypothetical protein